MRGYKVYQPVISTYSVGNPRAPDGPRGARSLGSKIGYPLMAVVGTASVVAAISMTWGGEPGKTDTAGTPSSEPARFIEPGFDFQVESSQFTENVVPVRDEADPLSTDSEDGPQLPRLSVLQASVSENRRGGRPASQATSEYREANRGNLVVPPRARSVPADGCLSGCADIDGDRPPNEAEIARRESNVGPADGLLASPVGSDVEEEVELTAAPLSAEGAATSASLVEADQTAELVADTQDFSIVEPAAALAFDEDEIAAAAPPLEEPDSGLTVIAAEETAVAAPSVIIPVEAARPVEVAEARVQDPIAGHLARIDERYSSTPAVTAEPMPATTEVASPAAQAPRTTEGQAEVVLRVGEANASSAVIHDDELVAIKLGDLVSLLEDRFDRPLYVWMRSSTAASKFVTAETLAAAGIATSYDAERKQVVFTAADE